MTTTASRGLVVVLSVTLTFSLALGAAPAAVAGSVFVDDGLSIGDGIGLDGIVDDTVGGVVGAANASDVSNGTANATELANGTNVTNGTINGTTPSMPDGNDSAESNDSGGVGDVAETVETVDESTTSTVNETTSTTGAAVDETVNATGDALNGTANATNETVSRTVDGTNDTVSETANATDDAVDRTVNDTTTTATETVDGTDEPVAGTTDATGETVETVTGDLTGTLDDVAARPDPTNVTTGVTATVDQTTTDATATVDGTTSATTGAVWDLTVTATDVDLTPVVDGTGDLVRRTTDAVADAVDGTVEDSTTLLGDVVEGTVGGGADAGPTEDHGWPPADSASGDREPTGTWSGDGTGALTTDRVDRVERAAPAGGEESETAAATTDGTSGGGAAPRGPIGPDSGGAAVGAALLIGSLAATRTGMATSSMGGGAMALPQALFAALRWLLVRVAVLAGYSRYDFEDPLENENRAAVLETVESSPGINLTALVETTGLAESTVRYHLKVLESEGLLEGAKVRGRRRYVPRTDDDLELVAAFEEEATKDVLAALFEHEPATGTTLAEALDRDPSTVSHHLSRLAEAGLVDREQDGPALRNSLTPAVRRAFSDVEVTSSVQGHVGADD